MRYYICMFHRGFTFVEILTVVAVVAVLAAVAVVSLQTISERLLLRAAANDIGFALEAAKAGSVAGAGGVPHGVAFAADGYTEFAGESYDSDDADNVSHQLDPRLQLAADILNGESAVVFSRIRGTIGSMATITVSFRADPNHRRTVTIGAGGDISYGD